MRKYRGVLLVAAGFAAVATAAVFYAGVWRGGTADAPPVPELQAAGPQSRTTEGRINLTLLSLLSLAVCSWAIVVMKVHFRDLSG